MAPSPRPLYLEVASGPPVFAVLHEPDPARRRPVAVLSCPLFGWEEVAARRRRRAWSERLAAQGITVLRFDLPGTGDSGGAPSDPGQLASWVAATAQLAAWLGERGAGRVAAFGPGLGGLVALAALADGAPLDDLILWGVPSRGRALVREYRAFAGFDSLLAGDQLGSLPAGSLLVSGHLLAGDAAADLTALDVAGLALPPLAGRRALLLERDGVSVDERLRTTLESAGAAVTVAPGPGFAAFVAPPQERTRAGSALATAERWLLDGGGEAAPAATGAGSPAVERGEALFGAARERPWQRGPLRGVLSEPAAGAPVACALLLNAGAIPRTGPNRMWVETARRWAGQGVASLRLDVDGIGEADGDESPYARVELLYREHLVARVLAAMDDLEERGLPGRFVLLGLCSGAYWGLHAALADRRVRTVVALNPRALVWDASSAGAYEARSVAALGAATAWRRIARGQVPARRLAAAAAAVTRHRLGTLRAGRAGDDLVPLLDRLRDADQRLVLAFSGGELILAQLQERGIVAGLARWPNVTLETEAESNHVLRSAALQRWGAGLLDAALERELARARAREHA